MQSVVNKIQNVDEWIDIKDQDVAKIILEAYADDEKKLILATFIDAPKLPSAVLEKFDISQTSCYRKINLLLESGLIIKKGFSVVHNGRKLVKYISVFENLQIKIMKNKIIVKVRLNKAAGKLPQNNPLTPFLTIMN